MRYRREKLPSPWSMWLVGDVVGVRFFARQPSAGMAMGLALLVALGPLVFLIDLVARRTVEAGDLASGAIAIAVFALAAGWAVRERRRARDLAEGTLRLGVFLGPDALVWRETPDEVHVFALGEVTAIELTAAHHGKGRPTPGDFVVSTSAGRAVFTGASDYPAAAVVDALIAWGKLVVKVDPSLGFVTAPPSSSSAPVTNVASPLVEPAPPVAAVALSTGSASARFIALCARHGVEVELVREGYSEGSSLMSIDHATVYRLSRPLRIKLSVLTTVRDGLGPRDENWLDAEVRKAGGADAEVVVSALSFSDLTDFQV